MREPADFAPSEPKLLQIPSRIHTVADLLAVAGKLGLTNAMVLSQREDGSIVFMTTAPMTLAEANWLADSAKNIIWEGVSANRRGPR